MYHHLNVESDVFTSSYIINSIHKLPGYLVGVYPHHNSLPCCNIGREHFSFTLPMKSWHIVNCRHFTTYLYLSTMLLAWSSSASVANTFRGFVVIRKCFALPINVLWSYLGWSISILPTCAILEYWWQGRRG